jgi:hypothetical protein
MEIYIAVAFIYLGCGYLTLGFVYWLDPVKMQAGEECVIVLLWPVVLLTIVLGELHNTIAKRLRPKGGRGD